MSNVGRFFADAASAMGDEGLKGREAMKAEILAILTFLRTTSWRHNSSRGDGNLKALDLPGQNSSRNPKQG